MASLGFFSVRRYMAKSYKTNAALIHPAVLSDFRNFLALIWRHLLLPDPTPVQYDIATYLQHGPKRQVIEAFRGVGKSWITSAYVLWRLLNDPQEKFLVVSASKQRADDFSTFTLRLIKEVPMLQHLKPLPDQRESKVAFDVAPARASHAPSVKSAGVFGQLSGSRATHIIADDVEVPNNSATQDMREKLLKTVMEFEAIIMPEVGRITYLGTPQTEESIYNALRERGYECRIWPARVPKVDSYGGALAPLVVERMETEGEVWKPVDPKRFNDIDLTEREMAYGRSGFALQFMLDTSLSDAERYPLKTSDLIVTNLNVNKVPLSIQYGSSKEQQIRDLPNVGFTGDRWFGPMFYDKENWAEYEGRVMSIDPSGRGVDHLGYAVVNQLHGNLYLMDCDGLPGGYAEENLVRLAKIAKHYKVHTIIIESNFGDGMFTNIFKPVIRQYHQCALEEVKHSKQKELRIIDTLEPIMNQHRLIVDERLIRKDERQLLVDRNHSLFFQMTRINKERGALKHDDRLDALAIAVAFWVESMAKGESESVQAWRDEAFERDLERFMDHQVNRGKDATSSGKSAWHNWSVFNDVAARGYTSGHNRGLRRG